MHLKLFKALFIFCFHDSCYCGLLLEIVTFALLLGFAVTCNHIFVGFYFLENVEIYSK